MRLRYFHIREYPPLDDIAVVFSADAFLKTECRIRFVVGVNGSGKTSLLQALTETLLYLERRKRPHFPVTLAYELGKGETRRALMFHCDGGDYAWWTSDSGAELPANDWTRDDWENLLAELQPGKSGWRKLTENGWPGEGEGLPRTVLAYTTGHKPPWEALFREEPETTGGASSRNHWNTIPPSTNGLLAGAGRGRYGICRICRKSGALTRPKNCKNSPRNPGCVATSSAPVCSLPPPC